MLRSITLAAPFYLWLCIFIVQPHKEERFIYPAYPFLALNAAIAFHIILAYVGSSDPRELIGRVSTNFKFAVVFSFVLVAINAGLFRALGIVTAYNAPLNVYGSLEEQAGGGSVCLGKEWYRFPSSYFLPGDMRAKFIRSEFRGLLPGEFPEAVDFLSRAKGASRIPPGMNDRNEEDADKYVSAVFILACPYFATVLISI